MKREVLDKALSLAAQAEGEGRYIYDIDSLEKRLKAEGIDTLKELFDCFAEAAKWWLRKKDEKEVVDAMKNAALPILEEMRTESYAKVSELKKEFEEL